jgi:hypothetical protein
MLKIDNSLLIDVGLGNLPAAEKNSFLRHIYETLEMRVGIRLADQMTNEQLDEFEKYFEAKDDAGAFKWLETNFPNYKEIVQQEFDKLKAEVAQSAPQILAASQQAAAQGSIPGQPGQPSQTPPQPVAGQPMPPAPQQQPAFGQPSAPATDPAFSQPMQPPVPPAPAQPLQAPSQPYQPAPQQPPAPNFGAPAAPPQPQDPAQPPFPQQQPPAGPQ